MFKIYDSLGVGKKNGLTAKQLMSMHGISTSRELRQRIEAERRQGAVIASGNNGYYRPATQEELIEYIRRTRSMIKSLDASLQSAVDSLRQFEGQLELDLYSESDITA